MVESGEPVKHVCPITIDRYRESDAAKWRAFVEESNNGTLFHAIDFLAYHPPDKFETHHLLFRENGQLIALLPAAIVTENDGSRILKSPYGASVGGFVLPDGQSAAATLRLVSRMQEYVCSLGLSGAELRLAPQVYAERPNGNLEFALAASGFVLSKRWLTMIIPLPSNSVDVLGSVRSRRRRSYVRSARRKGVKAKPVDRKYLKPFFQMLETDRAKFGAGTTHSLYELERLFKLVPNHLQLFICFYKGEMIAGNLVFELNPRIAYSFYPCHDSKFDQLRSSDVLMVALAEHYTEKGFRYLDLGPASFDDYSLNLGLSRFKEDLGGVGYCRDAWNWRNIQHGES